MYRFEGVGASNRGGGGKPREVTARNGRPSPQGITLDGETCRDEREPSPFLSDWLSYKDAAERKGCSYWTVQNLALGRWVRSRVLPGRTRKREVYWPDVKAHTVGARRGPQTGPYAVQLMSYPASAASLARLFAVMDLVEQGKTWPHHQGERRLLTDDYTA